MTFFRKENGWCVTGNSFESTSAVSSSLPPAGSMSPAMSSAGIIDRAYTRYARARIHVARIGTYVFTRVRLEVMGILLAESFSFGLYAAVCLWDDFVSFVFLPLAKRLLSLGRESSRSECMVLHTRYPDCPSQLIPGTWC